MPNWGMLVKKIGLGVAEKIQKEVSLRGKQWAGCPYELGGRSELKGSFSRERL
jgi:hypothetical protein